MGAKDQWDSELWPEGLKDVSAAASKIFDNDALEGDDFNAIDLLI